MKLQESPCARQSAWRSDLPGSLATVSLPFGPVLRSPSVEAAPKG